MPIPTYNVYRRGRGVAGSALVRMAVRYPGTQPPVSPCRSNVLPTPQGCPQCFVLPTSTGHCPTCGAQIAAPKGQVAKAPGKWFPKGPPPKAARPYSYIGAPPKAWGNRWQ